MRRDQGLDQDINYNHVEKSTSTKRIDLNDLRKRTQAEKRKDSRTDSKLSRDQQSDVV